MQAPTAREDSKTIYFETDSPHNVPCQSVSRSSKRFSRKPFQRGLPQSQPQAPVGWPENLWTQDVNSASFRNVSQYHWRPQM